MKIKQVPPPLFVLHLFCFKIPKLNSKSLCLLHYPLLAVNETSTYQFKNQSKIVVWSGRLFEKYPLFVLELASLLAMFWPAQQMSLRGCHHLSRFTLFPIFSPTSLQPLPSPIFSAYNSDIYSDFTSSLFSHQHLFNLFQPIHIHYLLFSYQQSEFKTGKKDKYTKLHYPRVQIWPYAL